jgi:hypothetical protein
LKLPWEVSGKGDQVGATYIAQILNHIEMILGLLEFIPALKNGLTDDQIFGEFRPHAIAATLARFCRRRTRGWGVVRLHDTSVGNFDLRGRGGRCNGGRRRSRSCWRRRRSRNRRGRSAAASRPIIALVDTVTGGELRAALPVVALPRDLLGATADTVHSDTLGARRNVDEGPIASGPVICFARVGAGSGFAVVVSGLVGNRIVTTRSATRRARG